MTKVYNATDHEVLVYQAGHYVPLDKGGSLDVADDAAAARLMAAHPAELSLVEGADVSGNVTYPGGVSRAALVGEDATVPGHGQLVSASEQTGGPTQEEQTQLTPEEAPMTPAPVPDVPADADHQDSTEGAEAADEVVAEREAEKTTPAKRTASSRK